MRNRCRVNLVAIAKLYTIGGIPSQLSNVGVFLTPPFGIRWIWKRSSTCLCQLMDFREVRETRSRVLFPRAIYKLSEDSGCFFRPGDPEDGRREHEMRFLIRRTVEHGAWGPSGASPHRVADASGGGASLSSRGECNRSLRGRGRLRPSPRESDHQEEGMLA